MKTNKELKENIVSEIENNFKNANSLIVWKYHTVNSNEFAKLRIEIKKNQDINKIYKNRLFKIALKNLDKNDMEDTLIGPNTFLFLNSEDQSSLKKINDLIKNKENIEFIGGYIDNKYFTGLEVSEIANLPSKPEMISMLLSVLEAPMRNTAYAISQISENLNNKN